MASRRWRQLPSFDIYCMDINHSVAVGEHLLQGLVVPDGEEGRRPLQLVLLAEARDIAEGHLLGLLEFLIVAEDVFVVEVEDVVGVDVELNLVELVDLDALEEDGLEDLLDVEGLVGGDDEVDLLFEEAVEEDVVAAVGARADEVEVIDEEQEVLVSVLVEGLEVEDVAALGLLVDVGLEVRLVLFLDLLPLHYVHPVLVEPPLHAHPPDLLQERTLPHPVAPADVDVLLRLRARQLLEHLVHLLPLAEHRKCVAPQLEVNVVRLPEPWGEVLEAALDDPDNLLTILVKVHLDLLQLVRKLRSHLHVDLLDVPLVILRTEQALDEVLGDFDLVDGDLVAVLDDGLELVAAVAGDFLVATLLKLVELSGGHGGDGDHGGDVLGGADEGDDLLDGLVGVVAHDDQQLGVVEGVLLYEVLVDLHAVLAQVVALQDQLHLRLEVVVLALRGHRRRLQLGVGVEQKNGAALLRLLLQLLTSEYLKLDAEVYLCVGEDVLEVAAIGGLLADDVLDDGVVLVAEGDRLHEDEAVDRLLP